MDLGEGVSVPESREEAEVEAALVLLRRKMRERRLSLEGAEGSDLVG